MSRRNITNNKPHAHAWKTGFSFTTNIDPDREELVEHCRCGLSRYTLTSKVPNEVGSRVVVKDLRKDHFNPEILSVIDTRNGWKEILERTYPKTTLRPDEG